MNTVRAQLIICAPDQKLAIIRSDRYQWQWQLKTPNYEAIQGIIQTIRLVPDKLSITLAMHRSNIQQPSTIDYVITLLNHYIRSLQPTPEIPKLLILETLEEIKTFCFESKVRPIFGPDYLQPQEHLSLHESVKLFILSLEEMKQTLLQDDQDKFIQQVKVFFTIANQFELYATVCNNFLKPFFLHATNPSDMTLKDHARITQTLVSTATYVPNQVQDHILQLTLDTLKLHISQ